LRWIPCEVGALFVSLFFYFILISGGPMSEARFRAPIMPLVCIATGVAMAHWHGKCGAKWHSINQSGHALEPVNGV